MTRTPFRPLTGRVAAGSLALLASSALLVGAAGPAAAATTDVQGAAAGQALLLTLNLPGGAATKIEIAIDPVTGTVRKTTTATAATADATVLRGSLGGQSLDSGTSSAKLPSPTSDSSNPTGGIAGGLAGTPLANLLKVELLPSSAKVSGAPTSSSDASVANIGVGLPDALASALAPLTGPLAGGVDAILTALSQQSGMPVATLCANLTAAVGALTPVTAPLQTALDSLPIAVPVAGLLDTTTLGAVCGLSTTIAQLNAALQNALATLTGDSGVFGTGLITSNQTITRSGDAVTARAEASVDGLTLLGQKAFADAQVLRTVSTASVSGTAGSAKATIESTIADLTGGSVDPFLQVRTTIQGIRDSFVGGGALPTELKTVFDALFTTLNAALAPIGITLFKLDDSADTKAITGCPTALTGLLTGILKQADGRCAAAATRGVGIAVNLPAALAGPLMVNGPLVSLQIVPTSAVAQAQPIAVVAPPETVPQNLPRTGLDSTLLGGIALLMLLGAAAARRRGLLSR
ncbi:MAG: hypothetical protein LC779_01565 [Actinobacteria bacterium]|nr:hypothetical protein [Actinomycetota bacterium]